MALPDDFDAARYAALTASEQANVRELVFEWTRLTRNRLTNSLAPVTNIMNDLVALQSFVENAAVAPTFTTAELSDAIQARDDLRNIVATTINGITGVSASSP